MSTSSGSENVHPFEQLSPESIMTAVESIDYECDGRLLALNSYENRVYQVGIEDADPLIVKFYRPQRWSDEQILEEHRFCHELVEQELSVVPPLQGRDGHTLHRYESFGFTVFPRRGGRAPELDNLDHLETLGKELGRMHLVGAARPFQHRPRLDLDSFGRDSVDYLLDSSLFPELADSYRAITTDLLATLEDRLSTLDDADFIRVHGDCHAGNMLWRDDRPHFVDFDDARMAPGVQDLWMLLSGDKFEQEEQLHRILKGYRQFNDFDPRQLRWIEPLRTLRILHFSAWLARRWDDPAFPPAFPWFNTQRYWGEHILALREQRAALDEAPLRLL